jgi:hypothetical protein
MLAFFSIGMFTTIQSVALFIMAASIPPIVAFVRSLLFLKSL